MPPLIVPHWQSDDQLVRIYNGSAEEVLSRLPAKSIQTCVTSPPYWALRKYSEEPEEIGREKTFGEFVERLVKVFRELRRVLRDDGTFWLNIGDTWQGCKNGAQRSAPWRVAFALEEDGWVLRQDCIWFKRNPMPDGSATNRFVRAHEFVFMFTKGKGYYFDHEAIKAENDDGERAMRRDVWPISVASYPGTHYAVMPSELVEICVKAGTSEAGCCSKCGKPFVRVTERVGGKKVAKEKQGDRDRSYGWSRNGIDGGLDGKPAEIRTLRWQAQCDCNANLTPCTVCDPFLGSGTVADVSVSLGRRCIGIDLSRDYIEHDAIKRIEKAMAKKKGQPLPRKRTTLD